MPTVCNRRDEIGNGAKFEDPREYKGVAGDKGKFVSVKKDSQQDVPGVEPVYVVQYTDGDREDMDGAEIQFAHELHLQRLGIDVEAASDSCGSNDEDSY
jgi:hypothetical protein